MSNIRPTTPTFEIIISNEWFLIYEVWRHEVIYNQRTQKATAEETVYFDDNLHSDEIWRFKRTKCSMKAVAFDLQQKQCFVLHVPPVALTTLWLAASVNKEHRPQCIQPRHLICDLLQKLVYHFYSMKYEERNTFISNALHIDLDHYDVEICIILNVDTRQRPVCISSHKYFVEDQTLNWVKFLSTIF